MRRKLISFLLLALCANFANATVTLCPVTSGTLSLNCLTTRATGIAPLLVFFDCTATTDTATLPGLNTTFADVSYLWNFSDRGPSGEGNWAFGAHSAYSSKNIATGAIAAHVYVVPDGAGNESTIAIVTANDGTNRATCGIALRVFDPAGSNGFPGAATTCFFNSTVGTGCPAGATQTQSSTLSTPGSGHRFLYKCGDAFSGSVSIASTTTTYSVGAYGSCVGTPISKSNHSIFPQFTNSGGGNIVSINSVNSGFGPADGRFANIDFEGTSGGAAVTTGAGFNVKQLLIYNSYANSGTMGKAWYCSGCTQGGVVQSIANGGGNIETNFWNFANNTCAGNFTGTGYLCGASTPSLTLFGDTDYNAFIGDLLDNTGVSTSNTWEDLRVSSCRLCIFSNTQFSRTSPANGGANFKLHSGNSGDSNAAWLGKFTELIEIADNLFTGNTGGQMIEIAPQNAQFDERLQNIVFERNIVFPTGSETALATSGINFTFRNNVFYGATNPSGIGAERRGTEGSACSAGPPACSGGTTTAAPVNTNIPGFYEIFNNTCYGGGTCVNRIGWYAGASPSSDVLLNNSVIRNNLFFSVTGTGTLGASNTISNNSANTSQSNPNITNGSGSFSLMSDFKPTANFTGGTPVPNLFDALGSPWASTFSLGAVHP
jgi:hypothetical protein